MDTLPIAFLVDENIYMHLKPVCLSIIKHISIAHHFCILTDTSHAQQLIHDYFLTFSDPQHFTVKFISPEDYSYLSSIYTPEGRTDIKALNLAQCIIYRYFDFPKLLFMEPDQIVIKDLMPFWNYICTSDVKIGATAYNIGSITLSTLRRLYPSTNTTAYNCGVMVIDTLFWKNRNCEQLCINAILQQKRTNGSFFNYYAEGAINIALQHLITPLDIKYNTCNLGWNLDMPRTQLQNAVILHWNGPNKPWLSNGFYKHLYTHDC
jgi:lipopolysaccharide biosynthesis glycosyltransferase